MTEQQLIAQIQAKEDELNAMAHEPDDDFGDVFLERQKLFNEIAALEAKYRGGGEYHKPKPTRSKQK